jgi:hypothetical protein
LECPRSEWLSARLERGLRVPVISRCISGRPAWLMKTWDVRALDVAPRAPTVLSSSAAARVVALELPTGQSLQDHEVHERAWLLVVSGEVAVKSPGSPTAEGGPGALFEFAPQERREVFAASAARLLLFLAPWPGDGHPGALSHAQRSHARARAAAHERERTGHESDAA